jgi:hypothetical protein
VIPVALVASFAALSVGILLIGAAAVKEAFWPVPVRRYEVGSVAVEERG